MSSPHRRRLPAAAGALTLVLLQAFSTPALAGYEPDPNAERSQVPEEYRWQPQQLFDSQEAWAEELKAIQEELPTLAEYKGKLGESAQTLYECLSSVDDLTERLYRVYGYANLNFDVNQEDEEARKRLGRVKGLLPTYEATISYIQPEILTIEAATLDGYLEESEDLQLYAYYLGDITRLREHTLSPEEERIMALTSNLFSVPGDVHEALLEVDVEFPSIVDEKGEEVQLTQTGFTRFRGSDVYNVRVQATEAFFGTLREYENTLATSLDGIAKAHVMNKDARGYSSCLEAALTPDNISTDAYEMLIDTVHEHLPDTLHKYISMRRKVMQLDGPVTFPNLYNPLVEGKEPTYTYEEGRDLIVEALEPLGDDYLERLEEGMDPASGWIDVYPNANKRSGAYSAGFVYDSHPYILHNFDNSLDAVFTTAHEFGHALHSVYSNENQPFVYSHYTTFLAEIASTTNEELLLTHLLENTDDPETRLLLLNQRLENIRLTIFRQTLFAEFEKRFHEHAESGEALTAEFLNDLYAELISTYYGPDYEVSEVDAVEWAFIPHFYYDFYVFSYATGLTSGIALARQILEEGDAAADRYKGELLSAGSSAPPMEILASAGVDLESPEPIEQMLELFEETVEEFETLYTETYLETDKKRRRRRRR